MKDFYRILGLLICLSLASCKSIISNPGKPLKDSSIKLNCHYEIQDFNAKVYTVRITGIDREYIYGTSGKDRKMVVIEKSSIRQLKKWQVAKSILVGILAIATVIFTPI